ncbi:sorting and assembly machinery component 50 homolog isoform X2 [Lineus longissimus]|uniref:sorting and assembly machinery component 50 homolog isoform X2 n=1 Tax=Lineus longissimus TaxID=88925 RepID=UPI002B4D3555
MGLGFLISEMSNLPHSWAKVVNVHIDGLGRTKDDLVMHEVRDVFKASSFKEMVKMAHDAKLRLERLGIFKNVGIFIDTSKGANARKDGYDITFEVNEMRRVVGGVNTLVGNNDASLLFNLRAPNTFGRAEKFVLEYSHGTKHSSGFNVNFTKPFEANPDAKFTAGVYQNQGDYPWSGYKETDRGVGLDISFQSLFGAHGLKWEGVWRELHPLTRTAAFDVREQCGHSLKSSISHTYVRDRRDDPVIPTSGSMLKIVQEYAGLGGDVQFMKHNLEFQISKSLIFDTVLQLSLAGGVMKSLNPNKDVGINDRFYLGGPLTLRGFNMKGVGPHTDGCAMGGEAYGLAGLHLYTPLPFRPGRGGFGDLFRTHFFVNAGNLTNIDFEKDSRQTLEHLYKTMRLSYGAGIVLRMGRIARMELNYCIPFKVQAGDSVNQGVQFGIGVTFM